MSDSPQQSDRYEYINCRQIEAAVKQVFVKYGISGNPFAEVPSVGTLGEQLTISNILLDLPREFHSHPFAKKMVRSAVLSRETQVHPSIQREKRRGYK